MSDHVIKTHTWRNEGGYQQHEKFCTGCNWRYPPVYNDGLTEANADARAHQDDASANTGSGAVCTCYDPRTQEYAPYPCVGCERAEEAS